MAVAIETKYVGKTKSYPARVCASIGNWRSYVNYDNSLSTFDNHKNAVKKVLSKLNYTDGEFVFGMSPSHASGYVFIRYSGNTVKI